MSACKCRFIVCLLWISKTVMKYHYQMKLWVERVYFHYTSIWQFIIKGKQRLKQSNNLEGETEAQTVESAAFYFIHCDLFRPLAFSFSILYFFFPFLLFLSFLLFCHSISLFFLSCISALPLGYFFTENRYFFNHTICSDYYYFFSEILPPLFPNKSTHFLSPHRIQVVI